MSKTMMCKLPMYIVGGAVRDYYIAECNGFTMNPPKDIDIAVEASSYQAMRDYLSELGCEIYTENPEFGTLKAKACNEIFEYVDQWLNPFHHYKMPTVYDFAICRCDGKYTDGRHPETVTPSDIVNDLARRDFTMNAMAMPLQNSELLLDLYGGLDDIKDVTIKTVRDPYDRFNEDGLRILRALRFHVTLGYFISDDVFDCIYNNGYEILTNADLSTERIREELNKMLRHDTWRTLDVLLSFDGVKDFLSERDEIWFKPTTEKR